MEEWATSQRMQAAPRSWKMQGSRFFPRICRKWQSHDESLDHSLVIFKPDFRPTDLYKVIYLCCFKPLSLW